jgi:predicted O-linked N-acetylglucosamine transferase (SPINDLY family)
MDLHEDALAMSDRAIAIAPTATAAWITRGNALQRTDRLEDALTSYNTALKIAPDNIEALIARGGVLASLGRADEAVATLDRIPLGQNLQYLNRRAELMRSLGLFAAASRDFRRLVEISRDPLAGWIGLAVCASECCDWTGLVDPRQKLLSAIDAGRPIPPFLALQLSSNPAQHLANARANAPPTVSTARKAAGPKARPSRMRLAYISPDFRLHPVAFLIAELLERHDRDRFEIIAVSLGPHDGSEIRARIVGGVDYFHDMNMRSDDDIVSLLRNLKVDIAIDLAGYTLHARPSIMARRVAPIQVSYLGYCGTSGSTFIDYLLVDRIAVPPKEQCFFTECRQSNNVFLRKSWSIFRIASW